MGSCLPKAYICDTHRPAFDSSLGACTLSSAYQERRARKTIGGTFFRSIEIGESYNNITIECQWLQTNGIINFMPDITGAQLVGLPGGNYSFAVSVDGGPSTLITITLIGGENFTQLITDINVALTSAGAGATATLVTPGIEIRSDTSSEGVVIADIDFWSSLNSFHPLSFSIPTSNQDDVSQVQLTVTDGITTENYFASQDYTSGAWTTNAIGNLRSQVNSSSILISMPTSDGISEYNSSSDDDHIGEFSTTNLTGGSNIPDPTTLPPNSIRTGPVLTMIYAGTEDIDGNPIQQIRVWSDTSGPGIAPVFDWVDYDPISFTCYEATNVNGVITPINPALCSI